LSIILFCYTSNNFIDIFLKVLHQSFKWFIIL